jgi:hypothetical protein
MADPGVHSGIGLGPRSDILRLTWWRVETARDNDIKIYKNRALR